jgi:hypothetical protein
MRKIWFALLFLAGGISQEMRNPLTCETTSARYQLWPGKRRQSTGSTDDEKT